MTVGTGTTAPSQVASERVFTGRALGSPLRLTLRNVPLAEAETAWKAVVDEFDAVDGAMSAYRADSEVTQLNERAGHRDAIRVERRLYDALALADRAWRRTGGRFDTRVLAVLLDLGRPGVQHVDVPDPVPTPTDSGIRRFPRERSISVSAPVDLGGLGKGLALRWAWRRLAPIVDLPGRGGFIEAGGDLVGHGPGPAGDAWLIRIDSPDGATDPVAVVELGSGGLCTSSTEVSTWVTPDGQVVHHLIDPRTGRPGGQGLMSVTVATPDPAWAEIWSKVLFLAGPEVIGPEARSLGLAAWWVTRSGGLEMTPAARQRTVWS